MRAVITRSLRTDPEARFQSAVEFAAALREVEKQANAKTVLADLDSVELPPPVAASPKPAGAKQLGRYTVLEEVASGRSGRLYKAFDPVRGRLVGLKVVDSNQGVDRERMLRAARVWVDIVHENIVRILDVDPGGADHGPLIVTELVSGTRLDQFVIETPLNLEQRILIVAQICRALHHVHAQGVIHREVTPENILIVRDGMKAMLLDSGIARPVTPDAVMLTHAGSVVGDLAYMAPEQVNGRPEQRSDLFSLGAVLYLLLTGTPPSVLDLTRLREEIRTLADVPARVREVLLKALEPLPSKRYDSAGAFEAALKDLLPLEVARVPRSRMVVTLHGIRTHARWQRAFSEVAAEANLRCLLDRWNFGYFSVFRFIFPWSRATRISWFRRTYQEEFPELMRTTADTELPSIVAHSFGTYILGHALLRYPYLRFDRVVLCGSILPADFPWASIIGRGQVQAVRNEYGAQDFWTHYVDRFVPRTGPSGIFGFHDAGSRVEQEKFDFSHSEYFERSHMQSRWLPFLLRRMEPAPMLEQNLPSIESRHPWALYAIYTALLTLFGAIGWVALR
jgi:serine/threonine-protein kinase